MVRDEDRSREELIEELQTLRKRLSAQTSVPSTPSGSPAQSTFVSAVADAPLLVYLLDLAQQQPLYVNPAGQQLLGDPSASSSSGRGYFEASLHPADLPRYRVFAKDLQEPGDAEIAEGEFRFREPDGGWRRLLCREIAFAQTPDQRPSHVLGCAIDVAAQRQLEERVRRTEKMQSVGRLAGGLAHEFNNLLTVVVGYSDLLLNGLTADDPRQQQLREIKSAGQQMAERTGQLLAFAQRAILHPRVLDLNTFLLGAQKSLRHLVGRSIVLSVQPEARSGLVWADPGQVYQMLLALCLNACAAMPDGGRLTIDTTNATHTETNSSRASPHVVLTITDTGHGMTSEALAHLFEPFYSRRGVGTGLDLAAVHGSVQQSGGHIEVESEPRRGTTFRVYLPQAKQLLPTRSPGVGLGKQSGCWETVLIVSDEPPVRQYTQTVLQQAGHAVLSAATAEEALLICSRHSGRVHLVLTDVELLGTGGRELADRLRATHPAIRVLYMTGYGDDAVSLGLVDADAPILAKPFSPLALIRRVRELLDA